MADVVQASSTPVDGDVSTGLSDVAAEFIASEPASKEAAPVAPKGKPSPKKEEKKPVELADDEVDALDDKPAPKKWKLKANGKEYEVDSEDKLVAAAQRGLATEQQYQKIQADLNRMKADLEQKLKAAEEREALVNKDPASYLRSLGDKSIDAAEQLLLDRAKEKLEMENMTPRERQLYQENKKNKEEAQLRQKEQEAYKAKQEEQLVAEQEQQLDKMFGEVITKHGLPKNNLTVRVMAAVYRSQLNKGVELTPDQTAELTKNQLRSIADNTYAKMKPEDFIEAYPELVDGIRKVLVSRARGKTAEPQDLKPRRKQPPERPDDDDDDEWDRMINKLKKEGHPVALKARFGY